MSAPNPAYAAASTETDFQSFSDVSLKPLLEFIAKECLVSMPSSGLSLVDFVLQLLAANKRDLDTKCRGGKAKMILEKSNTSLDFQHGDTRSESFQKCKTSVSDGMKRRDANLLKVVFDRHKDSGGGLSKATLVQALMDANAPIIPNSIEAAASVIARIDIDSNDRCEFREFTRAANEPDELALYFQEKQLPALADALRALVGRGSDQLLRVSQLSDDQMQTATAALCSCLPDQIKTLRTELALSFLVQSELQTAEQCNGSKFIMTKMQCGSLEDFHAGLTGRIGVPHLDFKREMMREHCVRAGCNVQFTTGNYAITTTPKQEWMYIVGDEIGQRILCPDENMQHGRTIVLLEELMQKNLVQTAKLTDVEVLALVLYTGPLFHIYNIILRRYPFETYKFFEEGCNTFPTTIFVLVSAVTKVTKCTRIPEGTLLYRGLGGLLDLPEQFQKVDEHGASGYADWGFMSTTANLDVALGYSGLKQRRSKAMVMVIESMSVDKGADISMFSQYPVEQEFLWVPCSFVQRALGGGSRVEVVDGGLVTFVPVKVNLNLRMETVEELKEKKKRSYVVSARAMVDDVRFELEDWKASSKAVARLLQDPTRNQQGTFTTASLAAKIVDQCQVVHRHFEVSAQEFVDDGMFRMLVSEMLDIKLWAKEKILLWMQDKSQYICYLQNWSLRDCHRMWQSFLQQSIDSTVAGSSERALASLELLVSRGLVKRAVQGLANVDGEDVMHIAKRSVRGQRNVDGEDLLVQAGGDGWIAADISAAVSAGADVEAINNDECNGVWNAARYGHAMCLSSLISVGIDPHKCNKNGASPMFIAALYGHAACIIHLTAFKCDVNKCHINGCSPIFAAAQNGHTDCITLLVSKNADVKICNHEGAFPIFIAASYGHADCIPLLVSSKGDVNICNKVGTSPIYSAACNGHFACIQLLLACAHPRSSLEAALEQAHKNDHTDCIRVLEDAVTNARI